MNLAIVIATLNQLLAQKNPGKFNSSWIRSHAPRCYRFIQLHVRREWGGIDWDRITGELDRQFQRRWHPRKRRNTPSAYEDRAEFDMIRIKYQHKLYVFVSALDTNDRRLRDIIGISFVRLAQKGNQLARREIKALVSYTVDEWVERHDAVSRWRGHEQEMQKLLDACIRRYRYTGSFLTYLFRTLEYAARGIAPARVSSIDDAGDCVGYDSSR
ncbi:MAG TPA: hypothetical protein VMT22_01955 [Terriglobales bacterium]|nr:hypothetical protein [Terriglobales bacterium]